MCRPCGTLGFTNTTGDCRPRPQIVTSLRDLETVQLICEFKSAVSPASEVRFSGLLKSMRSRLLTLLLALSALTGCGVPGTPMPPSLDMPKFVGDLRAVRKGDTVTLTWTTPTETTDGALIRKPGKLLLQRALTSGNDSDLNFQTISEQPLPPALKDQRRPESTASDSLHDLLAAGGQANFAVYVVVAQNRNGKSFGLPNRASVPLVQTLPAPTKVQAEPVPDGVRISWGEAGPPRTGGTLNAQYAYRILRRLEGSNDYVMVTQLNAGNEAKIVIDSGIEWEKTYQYWVRPVTLWRESDSRNGEVEGDDSPVVNVFAHDSFPPAVPSAVQAVYSGVPQHSFIDITWSPNTEPDLAGYNVYRRLEDQPVVKINSELVKTPRFADSGIQPGIKYIYSVSAVDLRGNESGKSPETSETVPKR